MDHVQKNMESDSPRILLGLTGSVAVVKLPDLVRWFARSGCGCITLVFTKSALRFLDCEYRGSTVRREMARLFPDCSFFHADCSQPRTESDDGRAAGTMLRRPFPEQTSGRGRVVNAAPEETQTLPLGTTPAPDPDEKAYYDDDPQGPTSSRIPAAASNGGAGGAKVVLFDPHPVPFPNAGQEQEVAAKDEEFPPLRVYLDEDEWSAYTSVDRRDPVLHIELVRQHDCFLIAPLSCDSLAKITQGRADNLLTAVVRAWPHGLRENSAMKGVAEKPILVAPSMNQVMWEQKVTDEHLLTLKGRGVVVIDPAVKTAACGDEGRGPLADPMLIVARVMESWRERARQWGNRLEQVMTSSPLSRSEDRGGGGQTRRL